MALLEEFWHWRLALRFQKLMPVPASVFVPVFVTISLSLLISQCFSLFLYISVYTLTVSVSASVCLSVCLSFCIYLFPLPPLYVSDVSSPTPLVPWCLYACLPAAMVPTLTILDHPFILLASPSWIFSLYVILVKVCPSNKTVNKKAKKLLINGKISYEMGEELH